MDIGSIVEVTHPTDPEAGGRFRVCSLRARGGQGFVYILQNEADDSPAVLKVPGPGGLVGNEVERRILQTIPPHENVVRLLGTADIKGVECPVLSWAHENPFLRLNDPALESATRSYRGLAPRTALPATTAIEMIHEVVTGLEHMHSLGFVHGDVKSANVLVEIDATEPKLSNRDYFTAVQQRAYRTVLVDFGSTRSTAFLENMDQQDEALAPSEFTPLYAPPEVFRGIGDSKGGPGVDAYQVGLLLYTWLSGHPPYDHVLPNLVREGLTNELVDVKRNERAGKLRPFDPIKLKSARQQDVVFAEAFAAQRLRDHFFEDVHAFIDLATAPDPSQRPSMASLKKELVRLFELEAPAKVAEGLTMVSYWNPRWHLTRQNRLSEAARVSPGGRRSQRKSLARKKTSERSPAGARSRAETRSEGRPRPKPEPQRPPAKTQEPAPAPPATPKEPGGRRVALIDDDKVALAMLARSLRRRGFLIRTFQDPESALEAISRDHPDAAIVDMHMPGMTGLDIVRELERRLSGRPFPLLFLTAVEDERAIKEAYRHGVSDYLVKPVTEAELAVKLENAIEQFSQGQTDQIPRELGGFELLEAVRSSEAAVIYRGTDLWGRFPEPVKGVKVLRPELAGQIDSVLKLRREIDVLSFGDHPMLPRLHSSGVWGRLLFYVADDLGHPSLADWLRDSGRSGVAVVIELLRELCAVLDHLHQRGILAGSLTPDAIRRAPDGRLFLTDLGYARYLGGSSRGDEPVPSPSRYLGPEWKQDPPSLHPSSDLYPLGVLALEAYSGRPARRTRRGGGLDVRVGTAEMPDDLAHLVQTLLHPDPLQRPADAQAVVTWLDRV